MTDPAGIMAAMIRTRLGMIWLVGAVLLVAGPAAAEVWPPPAEAAAVRLHPDLPEYLDRAWTERLSLFPDLDGLERVRFGRAPWGGVLARLELDTGADRPRVLVRSLTDAAWADLQRRAELVLAGEPLPPPVAQVPDGDTDTAAAVWPEGPPPPAAPVRSAHTPAGGVPVRGRWLAVVEAGARVNVSGYNDFFTPMGQLGVSFAHGVSDHFLPAMGVSAAFGDMRGDFEDVFGDGRTNTFGFTLSALWRQRLAERHSVYLEGGGGWFIRSLYWGGTFYNPATGDVTEGRVVEQSDFGWSARAGWLISRPHHLRPRFVDVGVGVQTSKADPWVFAADGNVFAADGRDTWIYLAVRIWDGI